MQSDIEVSHKMIGNVEREFMNLIFKPKNLDGLAMQRNIDAAYTGY